MGRIKVKADGTILLGEHVSCDGFACERPVRVQTHIHYDHMVDFNTSKANQTILMSEQTRDLLFALQDADLPYRTNIRALQSQAIHEVNGDLVELLPSHHMLGSVQVRVKCSDGYRVGYSSDFFWPLEHVIEVDELIVDSTYGDPAGSRCYSQEQVDESLTSIMAAHIRSGRPTVLIGHNGRLQHALHLISDIAHCPIICSPRSFALIDVYRRHGYMMPDVISSKTEGAITILRRRSPCVACVTLTERRHLPWVDRCVKISLSARMSRNNNPVVDYGNGDCCVAFTDHADFEGTLKYIAATGARLVWTDPRTGNAEALAQAATAQLGVKSFLAQRIHSFAWG